MTIEPFELSSLSTSQIPPIIYNSNTSTLGMNNSSKPFTLNSSDVFRSFALAVVVAVLGGLQQMLQAHGFDFAHWDYAMILNLGISAFVAQLGINFVSNPDRTINIPAVGAVGPKVPNA